MTAVGVVGSSARAAVHSLARAGFSAWSVDQFADRDLTRAAACAVCAPDRYPATIPALAEQFPPGPVLYTGGLENHPHIVAALSRSRELWGNPPEILARVRDPFALAPVLRAAGCATPRLVPGSTACPTAGRWLRKPYASGGGIGIRYAVPGEAAAPHHYFQEFVDGSPMSALYHETTLLGATEQLVGEPWLHGTPFAYCGNIGPIEPLPIVARLGALLSERTGLRGVWGIDFVPRDGEPVALEVNPRYTAAVEVLEHAKNLSCSVGKAVYYAPHAITFPRSGPWDADLAGDFDPWRLPRFADIPDAGCAIQPGWPVLTIFVTGSTREEVRERLQSRAGELDRLFTEPSHDAE